MLGETDVAQGKSGLMYEAKKACIIFDFRSSYTIRHSRKTYNLNSLKF